MRKLPPIYCAFTLLIVMINACSSPRDCQKFKNGKFRTTVRGFSTIIERTGAIQHEFTQDSTVHVSYMVTWIDDCSFTLKPNKDFFDQYKNIPENALIFVTITKVNDNSYEQTVKSDFMEREVIEEVVKID